MSVTTTELNDILARISQWPAEQRLTLARSVLATIEEPIPSVARADDVIAAMRARYPTLFAQADTQKLHSLIGIAAGDRPPPSDAEVNQWIHESRMEKYGS